MKLPKISITPKLRFVLAMVLLVVTLAAFGAYIQSDDDALARLARVQPFDLVILLLLYGGFTTALMLVLHFSLALFGKKFSLRDNFLLSAYSSLTNFFGPGQSGPGVRAIYLKAKLELPIKKFIFASLIYYGFYAVLSILFLLLGAGYYEWSFLAIGGGTLLSVSIMKWYQKKHRIPLKEIKIIPVVGIFLATLLQICVQTAIYFVEIASTTHHTTLMQVMSFTGAANFSLFVSLTPAGIGIREAFLVFSQQFHQVGNEVIVAVGVLDRAVYVVFLGLLFLAVLYLHGTKFFKQMKQQTQK